MFRRPSADVWMSVFNRAGSADIRVSFFRIYRLSVKTSIAFYCQTVFFWLNVFYELLFDRIFLHH